jgi:hypothetical protein
LIRPSIAIGVFSIATAVATTAHATWSIVLADASTGEVAIGTATCITGEDLAKYVPVIRVGKGVAAAQAQIDQTAKNRKILFEQLALGAAPESMLALIEAQDTAFQKRQFGIADLEGRIATFTGAQTFPFASGLTGRTGDLVYAIQGNVITGQPVLNAARDALLATKGDLATRLMAAMEAARLMGGDGRCSCPGPDPTACGAPPASFVKSAHIGCMFVARVGDVDGICTQQLGCATGSYYLALEVKGTDGLGNDPDPVLQLATQFAAWRSSWLGRPDHLNTEAQIEKPVLIASEGTTHLTIQLRDLEGQQVPLEGAAIQVMPDGPDSGIVAIGVAEDLGDGAYRVPLAAGATLGEQALRVTVDDGISPVTLYPFPVVRTAPAIALTATPAVLSASQGGTLDLALAAGKGLGGRNYLVLCSATGTQPGFAIGATSVPLALDAALAWSYALCNVPPLIATCGTLDADGAAHAQIGFAPGLLRPLHPAEAPAALHFAFVTLDPTDFASNPSTIRVDS